MTADSALSPGKDDIVVGVGWREAWRLPAILGGAAVVSAVVALLTSLIGMYFVAVALAVSAAAVAVSLSSSRAVITVAPCGLRVGRADRVEWSDIGSVLLIEDEVFSYDGSTTTTVVALVRRGTDSGGGLGDLCARDALLVSEQVPGAVVDLDADLLREAVRRHAPDLPVIDLRTRFRNPPD
ncbi:hypothetical protein [Herbihabitans rhizosphaerae]|uniref:hypothetical protein n=1 Tax=Herbihabitans rhizosphaerae TaxID=1872711 RepID=UPI00102C5DB2|nr:hypothetical protein [Herbihabitans rhizosphaerae]